MTKYAVKKLARERKKSNEAFRKMSKPRRRVRICKDVLAAIEARKFIPTAGNWVTSPKLEKSIAEAKPGTQLDELLPDLPACNVCALGAIFLTTVKLSDRFSIEDYYTMPDGTEKFCGERGVSGSPAFQRLEHYLGEHFDKEQLVDIEAVFESRIEFDVMSRTGVKPEVAALVRKTWEWSDEQRLVYIMENIIANKGTFVP